MASRVETVISGVDGVHAYLSEYHPALMARLGARALDAIEEAESSIISRLPQGLREPVGAEIKVGTDWLLVKMFVRGRPAKAFVEGYDGPVDVRAYVRQMHEVFGKPVSPHEIPISEYVRRVQLAAHPLEAMAAEGIALIVSAMEAEAMQHIEVSE